MLSIMVATWLPKNVFILISKKYVYSYYYHWRNNEQVHRILAMRNHDALPRGIESELGGLGYEIS